MRLPSSRRRPYSNEEIGKVKCVKCGKPSKHQWRICSTSRHTAVCIDCDAEINRMVAEWAFGKEVADKLVRDYYGDTR